MSSSAEKQMKYDPAKTADLNFEILDLSKPKEQAQSSHSSRETFRKHNEKLSTDAQIVVYESPHCSPQIVTIKHLSHYGDLIENLSVKTHQLCQQFDTVFPYTIIRSLVENFIHAEFAEPIISILESGNMLRLSDQGCGIKNKDAALLAGFSTAKAQHKTYISGVGSGLSNVLHYANMLGGTLTIEDNLNQGTVVTLSLPSNNGRTPLQEASRTAIPENTDIDYEAFKPPTAMALTERQQEVLVAVKDCGHIGPSQVAELLDISIATAYRDLQYLEHQAYVYTKSGKRIITKEGIQYLDTFIFHL